jgi:hypothetical protein
MSNVRPPMSIHVRNVRALSVLLGVCLALWAIRGLVVEEWSRSALESWLIIVAFATVLVGAGLALGRSQLLGRALLGLACVVMFLYAAAWLFLGGVEDAGGYWPFIVLGVAFASYASLTCLRHSAA